MTKFLGRLASVAIAKEASRGTPESTPDFWIPTVTLSLDDEIEQVVDESAIAVIEDGTEAEIVSKIAVGSMEGNVGVDSIGLILLNVFGSVSTGGPTDSAYTHTYNVGQDAQHDSLTFFINEANQDWQYGNGMISDFVLDVVLGTYAKFTAGFRAVAGVADSLTTSFAAETRFLPQHGTFKMASAQSGLDGASATNIRRFTLNVEKNLEDDRAIGSVAPVDILNGQFMVSGSVEMVYDADAIKDTMLADTAQAIRITLTNAGVTIGAGTNPSLQFDLYKAKISNFKRNLDNGAIVTASFDFKGLYSISDSKSLEAVLVNDTASY